ncbi:MAG: hypothetical protein KatS3mg110_2503 [Pirellulaceae bacterium]|nr:MAG: hypothetical protein KatS3mg110_2503 [Pirellulaceae bacterium]
MQVIQINLTIDQASIRETVARFCRGGSRDKPALVSAIITQAGPRAIFPEYWFGFYTKLGTAFLPRDELLYPSQSFLGAGAARGFSLLGRTVGDAVEGEPARP